MRAVGKASSSGGKNKEQRVKQSVRYYLSKARALQDKLESSKEVFPTRDKMDVALHVVLDWYMELLEKHIDLLERRVIKGEVIPHDEKMFSIFDSSPLGLGKSASTTLWIRRDGPRQHTSR